MKTTSFAVAFVTTLGLTACQTTAQSGRTDFNTLSATGLEFVFQLTKIRTCDYRYWDAYPYLKKHRPQDELSAFAKISRDGNILCKEAVQVQSESEKIAWLKKIRQFNRPKYQTYLSYHEKGVKEDVTLSQYVACEQYVKNSDITSLNFATRYAPNLKQKLQRAYQKMVRVQKRFCPATVRSIRYGGEYWKQVRKFYTILHRDIPRSL